MRITYNVSWCSRPHLLPGLPPPPIHKHFNHETLWIFLSQVQVSPISISFKFYLKERTKLKNLGICVVKYIETYFNNSTTKFNNPSIDFEVAKLIPRGSIFICHQHLNAGIESHIDHVSVRAHLETAQRHLLVNSWARPVPLAADGEIFIHPIIPETHFLCRGYCRWCCQYVKIIIKI